MHLRIPAFALLAAALLSLPASAQTVRFETNLGNIDVELQPDSAPLTVENFLRYVKRGAYANSFIHRSVPGFIIQGGGYQFINNFIVTIPSDPPVRNEYKLSNIRGTIAMAKLGSDPNSATNQWFFNLANNASTLDNQNGGFTVFGRVSAGLSVMDKIAGLRVYNSGSPFDELPLQSYSGGSVAASNLVMITSIRVLDPKPAISQNGVISASSFGGYATAAIGSFLEIYGSNLSAATRGWASEDFTSGRAPTSLEGVTVTIGGRPAFVNFVSPNQVNVQVPAGVASGTAIPVVVTYGGQASAAGKIAIQATSGGLLAPPSFLAGGKQYAAAFHAAGGLVSNGSVPDIPAAPAAPGETLTFYGTGFGPITAGEVAGQIATRESTLATTVEFLFGDISAQVVYAGLAANYVGLYQFNVVVPPAVPAGDVPLKVLVGGSPISQSLFLPIGN